MNYDSGNSASLGYDVPSELAAYGTRIGSVQSRTGFVEAARCHSARRRRSPCAFRGSCGLRYQGDYVLQVARDEDGNEVDWARQNREYLVRQLGRIHSGASR